MALPARGGGPRPAVAEDCGLSRVGNALRGVPEVRGPYSALRNPLSAMICLADLAHVVRGRLHFGPMPPVHGEWTTIGRIALDSRLVSAGDLFWRLPGVPWQSACSAQHALFRGAAGVVAPTANSTAWPGTFCLEVEDPVAALQRLVDWLQSPQSEGLVGPDQAAEKNRLELKDLQLCRYQGLDITPPTCGRPGREPLGSCRRRAA